MPDHIILTAFGTTTRAKEAYHFLNEQISRQFPSHTIHWAYSSPTVRKTSGGENTQLQSVNETIASINTDDPIVVQSLHVLPGWEFKRITEEVQEIRRRAAIGLPLINDRKDLLRVAECLQPLIEESGDDAVLMLGHGTDHPCRSTYTELGRRLQHKFGARIFMSTLEFPEESPESTIARIAAAGYRDVVIIPLLLVAGMHFFRDITGENEDSWKNLLTAHTIRMNIHDRGLSMLPGVADIFCDHIRSALASLSS